MFISSVDQNISWHIKHYYQALNTKSRLRLTDLYPYYHRFASVLHKQANTALFDFEAFNYAINRLPIQIIDIGRVLLCKDENDLKSINIDINKWQTVRSNSRRRSSFYNPATRQILFFINSKSDIDDLINCLIAFQIEWNKIPTLIGSRNKFITNQDYSKLGINQDQWNVLKQDLTDNWPNLIKSNFAQTDIFIKKIKSTSTYQQVCTNWWQTNQNRFLINDFDNLPLYFISSNSHSLVNIIGGYVSQIQDQIFTYTKNHHPDLYQKWLDTKNNQNQLRVNDFLYYISSLYFSDDPDRFFAMDEYHRSLGIKTYSLGHTIPLKIQLIPMSSIAKSKFVDPYIKKLVNPNHKQAYIINVNYPLGNLANYLLNSVLINKTNIKGIYIIGKAAILSGNPGDMQIPQTVFDERTNNIFQINNCFNQTQFSPTQAEVHQNQKAISVYGTILENLNQLNSYQKNNFNIIEMESGPYLMSIAKFYKGIKNPRSQPINLSDIPVDLGIINYASDNPLNQNLGQSTLGIRGVESTYLSMLTVLQRIIDRM